MSAMLGPIHAIMYERIRLAGARQLWLRERVEERMSPGQREALAERLAASWHLPPAGELAELVGDAPIHGWLQQEMEATLFSEACLLVAVADGTDRVRQALQHVREHGQRVGEGLLAEDPTVADDARRLLRQVDRLLLTSMPCDPVSKVLIDAERASIVRRDLLFHEPIWRRAGLDAETALDAQEAWLSGLYKVLPGVRFLRADVKLDGKRWFDDRVRLGVGA